LLKGLLGWGFYAVAPVLFLCAVILAFHRGRPVRLRSVCALLLPLAVGALVHLFSGRRRLRYPRICSVSSGRPGRRSKAAVRSQAR
jgi:S-DNA-T family DNA segregation ATPase FtsK/SpoIIIE